MPVETFEGFSVRERADSRVLDQNDGVGADENRLHREWSSLAFPLHMNDHLMIEECPIPQAVQISPGSPNIALRLNGRDFLVIEANQDIPDHETCSVGGTSRSNVSKGDAI